MLKKNLQAKLALALATIPAAMVVAVPAHAELPAYVTAAFTEMQGNAEDLIAQGWPILVLIFGAFVLMKLFKKIGNKATS